MTSSIWQKAATSNMHTIDLSFVLKEFKELITVHKNYTQNVINTISSFKAVENKILVQLISKWILSIKFSISELTNNRAVSTVYRQVNLKSRFQFHVLIQIVKLTFSFSLTVLSFCASLLVWLRVAFLNFLVFKKRFLCFTVLQGLWVLCLLVRYFEICLSKPASIHSECFATC